MGILSLFRSLRRKEPPRAEKHVEEPPSARRAASLNGGRTGVLVRPVVTEKSTILSAQQRYVFRVAPTASKPAVRQAVERSFGVHVQHVRVVNVPGKTRRRGKILGSISGYRKAIVTLRKGEQLDLSGAPPFRQAEPASAVGPSTPLTANPSSSRVDHRGTRP